VFVIVKENLFPRSLTGATMQDGGIRERRDVYSLCYISILPVLFLVTD